MLFARYANPMYLVDKMIKMKRFTEFTRSFVKLYNEELENRTLWEGWLHKVHDQDYAEFLSSVKKQEIDDTRPSQAELETTVKDSMRIINSFCLS